MRRVRGTAAWAMAAALALAMPAAAARAPGGARGYTMSFADADIASVANEVLGQALHAPFSVDPAVTGKITLRIERPLTAEQLLEAFETALAANGVALVRRGDQFVITPRSKARESAGRASPRSAGLRAGYQLVTETLQYAAPSEVAKALTAAGPSDIVVHADDRTGLLVLGGTAVEIRSAEATIALFDRDGLAAAHLKLIPLQAASAEAVAADLERLAKAGGVSGVQIEPVRQLNAVLVAARSAAVLGQMEAWTRRFDQPSLEEASTLWIFHPRNVSADALSEALRGLSQSPTPSVSAAGAGAAVADLGATRAATLPVAEAALDPEGLRVSVEKSTNSLLVMAPASRWRALKVALENLDRAPDQVLIEATVLEVTLNQEFRLGVDWNLVSSNGKVAATLSQADTGVVAPLYPGLSVTYLNGGVRAVVDALSSRTNVEVMSAPKLVALDNQSASLQVGDQVPVVVQRAQGTGAPGAPLVSTTEYRDTGVILKIKPRVNGDHTVLLELSQEVSGVAKTTSSGIDSPTIQQRKFQSSLQVREDQTVALGGLISSAHSLDDVGVPWLKDIPLAGALFKTQDKVRRRTELIVLLNAHIIRSPEADQRAVDDLKQSMKEMDRRGLIDHP